MRRFRLMRLDYGQPVPVAEGVQFSDSTTVVRWRTDPVSTSTYGPGEGFLVSASDELEWLDPDPVWAEPEPGKVLPFHLKPATLT